MSGDHSHEPVAGLSKTEFREQRQKQGRRRAQMAVATGLCLFGLVAGLVAEHALDIYPLALALYALSYLAGSFFTARNALHELLEGSVNVDLLMVLAAYGAAGVGEIPEGAILLFLFSLSGTLEQFVLGRTRKAIEELMEIAPEEAIVLRDGKEKRVPVEALDVGDVIVVRPGERVAADGVIVSGSTSIDQSAMTGESIPVERAVGDKVFAGTFNQAGAIQVAVERHASESTLARIVRLVEDAQSGKADSQRFTDWFGERYTWLVLGGSLCTFVVGWLAFSLPLHDAIYRAMTVLVVASPCAVVISIPAAILSAIAAAAREGVLMKGGAHLEQIATIRAIALDKTGTLTVGRPKVVEILPAQAGGDDELLRLAASAESLSEHPLAKAIVAEAKRRRLELEGSSDLQAVIGRGAVARVGAQEVFVGKDGWFTEKGVPVPQMLLERAERLRAQGGTTVFVGTASQVAGVIGLSDTLRTSAQQAIHELRALGVEKLLMLTGDNVNAAKSIAGRLGIDYAAELMPEQKVEEIRKLREGYGSVAMIGDGINDAPSLAAATVGISLGGTGTAVALETADVVLMADNLLHLPFAVSLGRQALVIIKQNLVFAFGVMLALLATTFLGHLRLPFAVAGHEGSTVLVILNGLRLLRSRREPVAGSTWTESPTESPTESLIDSTPRSLEPSASPRAGGS